MSDSSVTAKQAQQKQWMKQWYENNKEYCKEQAQLYYFSHYPEIKDGAADSVGRRGAGGVRACTQEVHTNDRTRQHDQLSGIG